MRDVKNQKFDEARKVCFILGLAPAGVTYEEVSSDVPYLEFDGEYFYQDVSDFDEIAEELTVQKTYRPRVSLRLADEKIIDLEKELVVKLPGSEDAVADLDLEDHAVSCYPFIKVRQDAKVKLRRLGWHVIEQKDQLPEEIKREIEEKSGMSAEEYLDRYYTIPRLSK